MGVGASHIFALKFFQASPGENIRLLGFGGFRFSSLRDQGLGLALGVRHLASCVATAQEVQTPTSLWAIDWSLRSNR